MFCVAQPPRGPALIEPIVPDLSPRGRADALDRRRSIPRGLHLESKMDEIVIRAIAKWPQVPARRGHVSRRPVCGKRRGLPVA